jgi:hypothetical protein
VVTRRWDFVQHCPTYAIEVTPLSGEKENVPEALDLPAAEGVA